MFENYSNRVVGALSRGS